MAEKEKYIAQYRMPVGLELPPVNIPEANTPTEIYLTPEGLELLKRRCPGIKLRKVEEEKEEAPKTDSNASEEKEVSEGDGGGDSESVADSESQEPSDEPESVQDEPDQAENQQDDPEGGVNDGQTIVTETLLINEKDFPGRAFLEKVGIVSMEQLQQYVDDGRELSDIKGIGPALSKKILERLS